VVGSQLVNVQEDTVLSSSIRVNVTVHLKPQEAKGRKQAKRKKAPEKENIPDLQTTRTT